MPIRRRCPGRIDTQTGGVVFLLYFLDELVRLGYTGTDDEIVRARDAGREYLRDQLLRSVDGQRYLGTELLGLGRQCAGRERHRVRGALPDG